MLNTFKRNEINEDDFEIKILPFKGDNEKTIALIKTLSISAGKYHGIVLDYQFPILDPTGKLRKSGIPTTKQQEKVLSSIQAKLNHEVSKINKSIENTSTDIPYLTIDENKETDDEFDFLDFEIKPSAEIKIKAQEKQDINTVLTKLEKHALIVERGTLRIAELSAMISELESEVSNSSIQSEILLKDLGTLISYAAAQKAKDIEKEE